MLHRNKHRVNGYTCTDIDFVSENVNMAKPGCKLFQLDIRTRNGSKAYLSSSERCLTLHIIRHITLRSKFQIITTRK